MIALVASWALSQDGIPIVLHVIVTIARSLTEVPGLRLDRTGDARFCANIEPLCTAQDVDLSYNNLADDGVELLAERLPAPFFHSSSVSPRLTDRSFQSHSHVRLKVHDRGRRHRRQTITTLPTRGHLPLSFCLKFKECFKNTSVERPRNFRTLIRSVPVRATSSAPS